MNGQLLRLLGVTFGIAVIIGGTVGVGILRTPGEVAAHLGTTSLILLAWMLGGIYSMLGALSVTELGAALPRTGGFYVYVRRTFGERAGFAIGWCDLLGQIAAVAFSAVTIGEYTAELVPAVQPWTQWIAIGTVIAFAALHWMGLEASARAQEWSSLVKAIAFLAVVAACFLAIPAHASTPVPHTGTWLTGGILAAQAILYTYDGWYTAIYFTEEDKAPGRNLPRAMIGGVLSVTVIYLLINAAFLYALPVSELAASKLPAATAMAKIFGDRASRLITLLSLVSLPPLMNAVLLMATRILFALSRDGLINQRMAQVSESGTPRAAMLVCCTATIAMIATGTTDRLLAIAGFFYVVDYASAYLCVIALRRKEPNLPRPFRTWGYPYTTIIVLAVSIAFLAGAVIADTTNSIYAVALLALSLPLRRLLAVR